MRLILNGINGRYLREIVENAMGETEAVEVAVAYATQASLLFDWCWENQIPLRFRGRFDHEVPVSIPILKTFLDRRSARFSCRLIRHFHAKVIWWRGYGAYIGSANLTDSAWWNNVEAGFFLEEAELVQTGQDLELESFFSAIDRHSSPLTQEVFDALEQRSKQLTEIRKNDENNRQQLLSIGGVQGWPGLVRSSKPGADVVRKAEFLNEWNETLQLIRNLAIKVTHANNRPSWVRPDAPAGAQADQFLHAHYYQRTFEQNHARFEQWYERNRSDPDRAEDEAIAWWRALDHPPTSENVTLNEWAPTLESKLSPNSLARLDEQDFLDVFLKVHAIRDHARRTSNKSVNLAEGRPYTIDEKTEALARTVFAARSAAGKSAIEMLHFLLYGGVWSDVPERLWEAISSPEWKIDHLAVSGLGELVGWAMPDRFPPRNARTSKALRSLGHDVRVHA